MIQRFKTTYLLQPNVIMYEFPQITNHVLIHICVDYRVLVGPRAWNNRHQHLLPNHGLCRLAH